MSEEFVVNQEEYNETMDILEREKPNKEQILKLLEHIKLDVLIEPICIPKIKNNMLSRVEAIIDYGENL